MWKTLLDNAAAITRRMNSAADGTILGGHVLLALLEFDERYAVVTENATQRAGLVVLQRVVTESPGAWLFDGTLFFLALAQDTKIKANNLALSTRGDVTKICVCEVMVVGGG